MHNSLQINKTLFQTAEDGLVGQPTNVNSFFATEFSRVSFCRRRLRAWHKNSHAGNLLQGHRGFGAQSPGQGDLFRVALASFRPFRRIGATCFAV
jgi:hypothetical protein